MIDILYFASLRETLGCEREQLDPTGRLTDIASLKSSLIERGGAWQEVFSQPTGILVSVNQQMAHDETPIADSDEVAFFPPVTGG